MKSLDALNPLIWNICWVELIMRWWFTFEALIDLWTWFCFHCRRSPISIAAAIIFMVTQLSESKKPLRGSYSNNLICVYYTNFLIWASVNVVDFWYMGIEMKKEIVWLQTSRLQLRWQKGRSRMLTEICTRTPLGSYRNGTLRNGTWRISAVPKHK